MKEKYDNVEEFKKLSMNEKMELLPRDAHLAIGIINRAIEDGDYQFFDTDWAFTLVTLANYITVLPLHTLKKKALDNYNESRRIMYNNSIFSM